MHIGIVSRESYPLHLDGEGGGIGRYTQMTANGLVGQGAEVTVIAQNTANERLIRMVDGVRVVHLPKWEDTAPWSWRMRVLESALLATPPGAALWAAVSDKRRRADIVSRYLAELDEKGTAMDIVEFPDCGAEAFSYIRRPKRTRCVVRLHGPTSMICELNAIAPTPALRLLMWAERRAVALADHVTAPSDFAAAQAETVWGMRGKPAHVIANMLDTDTFTPPAHAAQRPGPPIIFFSGRLERRKGIMAVPEALARLLERGQDFQCRLAGRDTPTAPGGASMREWLLEHCPLGVRGRLVFLGQLDKRQLIRELGEADVGLYLSSYETFGYTCLEAQACGRTVVATKVGGTGETVRDGETGLLVDPGDSQAVADALACLLGNPGRRAAMGRAAREHVEKHYSLAALSREQLTLYRTWAGLA